MRAWRTPLAEWFENGGRSDEEVSDFPSANRPVALVVSSVLLATIRTVLGPRQQSGSRRFLSQRGYSRFVISNRRRNVAQ